MKQVRRLATRGVLVPFALLALIAASSIPASAATLAPIPSNADAATTAVSATSTVAVPVSRFGAHSISW